MIIGATLCLGLGWLAPPPQFGVRRAPTLSRAAVVMTDDAIEADMQKASEAFGDTITKAKEAARRGATIGDVLESAQAKMDDMQGRVQSTLRTANAAKAAAGARAEAAEEAAMAASAKAAAAKAKMDMAINAAKLEAAELEKAKNAAKMQAASAEAERAAALEWAEAEMATAEQARAEAAARAAASEEAAAKSSAALTVAEAQLMETQGELREACAFAAERVTELDDMLEMGQVPRRFCEHTRLVHFTSSAAATTTTASATPPHLLLTSASPPPHHLHLTSSTPLRYRTN